MTRDQGIEKARAWRQANWYDSVPEQLDEALYGYAADLAEELESRVRRVMQLPSYGLIADNTDNPMISRKAVIEILFGEETR